MEEERKPRRIKIEGTDSAHMQLTDLDTGEFYGGLLGLEIKLDASDEQHKAKIFVDALEKPYDEIVEVQLTLHMKVSNPLWNIETVNDVYEHNNRG